MLEKVFHTVLEAGFHEIVLVSSEGTRLPDLSGRTEENPMPHEESGEDNGIQGKFSLPGYVHVLNPRPEDGISSSIRLGVQASDPEADGWVFLMGDQPFLTAKTLNQLKEQFTKNPSRIIQPVYGNHPGGPVFFPSSLKHELISLAGDTGGRQVMEKYPELILRELLTDTKEAVDLDSRDEYEAYAGKTRVLVKGAGDLATGVIQALYQAGFEVIATEIPDPSCIRTEVAFASAVAEGEKTIDGITAVRTDSLEEAAAILARDQVPILIDPTLTKLEEIQPEVFVDAVIAKRNTGTTMHLAPLVIALGPGFTAGVDCHAVIETMRGESLGRIFTEKGSTALPDTGAPGLIAGEDVRRVIHAPASGTLKRIRQIGDIVEKDEVIAMIGDAEVRSTLNGTLRGLIQDGFEVKNGLKIADVDPRPDPRLAFAISDKAQTLGQAVIKAITTLKALNPAEDQSQDQ